MVQKHSSNLALFTRQKAGHMIGGTESRWRAIKIGRRSFAARLRLHHRIRHQYQHVHLERMLGPVKKILCRM